MPKPNAPLKITKGKGLVMPMDCIMEPELPARETMDEAKMVELIDSMREMGQLQAVLVVPREFWTDGTGRLCEEQPAVTRGLKVTMFEIVDGHRRYLAARVLRWTVLKVEVFEEKGVALEAARAHANLVREDMNAAEEAIWYRQLIDLHKLDEDGLCKLVLRKPDYIGDRLRLLRGDPEIFQMVRDDRITFAVGRELNKITDEPMRRYYLDAAVRSGTAHRVVSEWVRQWKQHGAAPAPAVEAAPPNGDTPEPEPHHVACFLCGGDKDTYNLVSVYIHKWEMEEIRKTLQRAAEGG